MSEPESPDHHRKNKRAQSITESSIIHNISDVSLSSTKKAVLEKGLNFCPAQRELNKAGLIDDVYAFCRKIRLKVAFQNPSDENKDAAVQSTRE